MYALTWSDGRSVVIGAVVILCNLVGNDPQASPSLREIPNFFGHLVSVLKLALDSSTISSTSLATWSLGGLFSHV